MAKRELSERNRQWLAAEMHAWQAEGVLSQEQPDRILALYETPQDVALRTHSVATFALMSVGALLVGLAALLLIGYNWEAMPKPAKLAVIFGVIAVTHGAGFWLRYDRKARGLSEVVFFLGCLFYGCGIWLVAQIFNISGHYPNALWMWALGTIPFALCLDTLLLHVAGRGLIGDLGWDRNLELRIAVEFLESSRRLLHPSAFGRAGVDLGLSQGVGCHTGIVRPTRWRGGSFCNPSPGIRTSASFI